MSQKPSGPSTGARIGLLGGAFDPPHVAHLALAQAALQQLGLSELLVLPTGHAWHKDRSLSPAHHRVAMAQRAFAGLPNTRVDPRETLRAGPTYTFDTVRELEQEHPGAQLWLLLGQDQWQALTSWHEWQALVQRVQLAVAVRRGLGAGGEAAGLSPAEHPLPGQPPCRPTPLAMPLMSVSATQIRQQVAQGQALQGLVSPAVARYIDQHHLYR